MNSNDTFYSRFGKRIFDLCSVILGLLVLSPVFAIVSLLIRLESKGPALFVHVRVGKNLKPIRVFKFRTMVVDADKMGPAVTAHNDPRKTRIGRVLRHYKIDELPQLLNVLNGTMSLVGPRPEVREYVDHYLERYTEILRRVKPGITDRAAIEYRDEEGILEKTNDVEKSYVESVLPHKLKYYEKYCHEVSFVTDISLILKTLKILVP